MSKISNIFSLSRSASQSFSNSGKDFKNVASAASDFITHGSAAVNVAPELGKQIGVAALAGGVAVVAGLGLCFASAVFFPAVIAPITGAVGWGVFTHPFSVVATAVGSSLIHDSAKIKVFGTNIGGVIKDTASMPFYATKAIGEAVIGAGQELGHVVNKTLIAIRSPNQEAIENTNGKHIQVIGESWFKSTPEKKLSEEDFVEIKDDIEENFIEINALKQEKPSAKDFPEIDIKSFFENHSAVVEKNQDTDITGQEMPQDFAAVAAA